ncbi:MULTISPECIES: hypothetical protein [unclassified Micromonospora]|uniref:hypothetical protein n=1 Tax=unclassified Micromonospora TaxID=2617518 RepID=UPI001C606D25|nr:hypothetical protein [Micromonospora sp. RL09-050-HVF-A]MBW4703551.1 hypothetical protein [Micromonospora sp. RL09-050-HVF-A]
MPKRRPAGPRRPLDPADPRRPASPAGARRPVGPAEVRHQAGPRRPVGLAGVRHQAGARRPVGLAGVLPAVVAAVLVSGCAVADAGQPADPAPTAAARTLRTPDTLLGLPRSGAPLPAGLPRFRLNELAQEASPATSTVERTYGRGRNGPETIIVSAVSGRITDPQATLARLLKPYRIPKLRTVEFGRFGGEARCGRGRTADEGHLTACAWADPEIAGVVVFLTATKQPDRKEDFLAVRDELEQPTG